MSHHTPNSQVSSGPSSLIRYMLYFSDLKVNMAYEQVRRSRLQRLAPDRLDVVLTVGGFGVTKRRGPPNRYEKLETVMQHLERTGAVGTVSEPRKYFRGTLDMRSDILPGPRANSEIVCFAAVTNRLRRIRIVVLVGSAKNATSMSNALLGPEPEMGSEWDNEAFAQSMSFNMPAVGRVVKEVMRDLSAQFEALFESGSRAEIDSEVQALIDVARQLEGFKQRCEFFAKRLHEAEVDYAFDPKRGQMRVHLLVGTPYYVALDE